MTDPEHEFWLHLTYSAAQMAVLRQLKGIVRPRVVTAQLARSIDRSRRSRGLPPLYESERAS